MIEGGEATFEFFLSNRSITSSKRLFTTMFNKLGLKLSYIPKILDLLNDLKSPTGSLLQIFIPRNKVNSYIYPSVAYARPLHTDYAKIRTALSPVEVPNSPHSTTTYDLRTINMKKYLDLYRNHLQAINPEDLDRIQGRINITHDFLLEPKSGVKIFRYTTVHPDKLLEYQQKLRVIIKEVMEDWKKENTTPANTQQKIAQEYNKLADTFGKNK